MAPLASSRGSGSANGDAGARSGTQPGQQVAFGRGRDAAADPAPVDSPSGPGAPTSSAPRLAPAGPPAADHVVAGLLVLDLDPVR